MLEKFTPWKKRRQVILQGISHDLKYSEISAQIKVKRGVIKSDIKKMRKSGDLGLKKAEETQEKIREKKNSLTTKNMDHYKQNEKYMSLTGITLQEQSFQNMIDFYRHELLKILRSNNQHIAIRRLPSSIQNTLKRNGIVVKQWQDNGISQRAQEYLTTNSLRDDL